MKTIILSILLISNVIGFAQPAPNGNMSDSLLRKSRNQKTAAWILLGVGAGATLSGSIITTNDAANSLVSIFSTDYQEPSSVGPILVIVGVASMIGSIPLFIASGRNRGKAYALSVNTQQIMVPVKGGWTYQYQPAIYLKIPIGRK